MTDLAILILAAGASSRMRGRDKLREDIAPGQSLLGAVITRAQAASETVLVTLPGPVHPRVLLIGTATPVFVPDAALGMSASLRTGMSQLPPGLSAVMILPADMPDLTANDLNQIAQAWRKTPDRILRATASDGTPGHPVIFPARLFGELSQLSGDKGARSILERETPLLHPLPDAHALTDLDTPEDWEAWKKARAQPG